MTKHDKNIDSFEYDCSENHEIMVVLMDLEPETLSESRSFYAPSIYMGFGSWFSQNYGFFDRGRVEIRRFLQNNIVQHLA